MASYPSLGQSIETRVVPVSGGRLIDFTVEGTPRGRDVYSATTYALTIIHHGVTNADVQTVYDFYIANKNATISVTSIAAGISRTYDCIFSEAGEPIVEPAGSGLHFTITSQLTGRIAP